MGAYTPDPTMLQFGTTDIHDIFKQHGFEIPIKPGDLVIIGP